MDSLRIHRTCMLIADDCTVCARSQTVGVSWPSGLGYRTQVLVLEAECGFESRAVAHLCP